MLPESLKHIWDAPRPAELAAEFVAEKTLDEYLQDPLLRSAVERQLQIVGEALGQLARRDPVAADAIPEPPRIVAFRNTLVHGYAVVDDELVCSVLATSLPILTGELQRLLREP